MKKKSELWRFFFFCCDLYVLVSDSCVIHGDIQFRHISVLIVICQIGHHGVHGVTIKSKICQSHSNSNSIASQHIGLGKLEKQHTQTQSYATATNLRITRAY